MGDHLNGLYPSRSELHCEKISKKIANLLSHNGVVLIDSS